MKGDFLSHRVQQLPKLMRRENEGLPVSSFWAFVYAPGTDLLEWRKYTPASLLDEVVAKAIANYHLRGKMPRPGLTRRQEVIQILRRIAASNDIFDSEVQAVQADWREWWGCHGASVRIASVTIPMKAQ